jgi:hypothetical protein
VGYRLGCECIVVCLQQERTFFSMFCLSFLVRESAQRSELVGSRKMCTHWSFGAKNGGAFAVKLLGLPLSSSSVGRSEGMRRRDCLGRLNEAASSREEHWADVLASMFTPRAD